MSDDLVLSAWQLYTGLFILFWAAQIYFSSFWMSLLCCIKLLTDYMYRRGRYKNIDLDISEDAGDKSQLNTLIGMARSEAQLVPSLTAMAKEEAGSGRSEVEQNRFNEESVLIQRHDGYRVSDL